jgi:uncharacterized membrane protein YbhN (UPF0104 family)
MWRFLIKAAVSAVLIALLLRSVNVGPLIRQMLAVDRGALLAAGLCYWAVGIPSALRWSIVTGSMGYPRGFWTTFPIVLVGYFFNLTLLSAVGGDAIRMWQINRTGLPPAAAIISVAIDRLMQYLAHLLIVIAALPFSFSLVSNPALRAGVVLLAAASVLGFLIAMLLDRISPRIRWLHLSQLLGEFSIALRRILLVPSRAMSTILLGLCNQCGVVLVVIILAKGLALPVTWLQCVVIVPLALLATTIPISIGGWGVRESAFVIGFGLLGVPAADALALSVLFGIVNLVVRLPGGLVWLALRDRKGIHAHGEGRFDR